MFAWSDDLTLDRDFCQGDESVSERESGVCILSSRLYIIGIGMSNGGGIAADMICKYIEDMVVPLFVCIWFID